MVHGEIQYINTNGDIVHSDICPEACSRKNITNKEYREYLHLFLDEWLDNSNGTGAFYIKSDKYNIENKHEKINGKRKEKG
tara:strand:+ start:1161 stop:1403 length:243 start_codon:yes stop_codon:yes gene_type:complete